MSFHSADDGDCGASDKINGLDILALLLFGGFGALIVNTAASWKFLIPLNRAAKSIESSIDHDPVSFLETVQKLRKTFLLAFKSQEKFLKIFFWSFLILRNSENSPKYLNRQRLLLVCKSQCVFSQNSS